MSKKLPENPWANRSQIEKSITKAIDHEAIHEAAHAHNAQVSGANDKRRLKGVYFDADIAASLDDLKRRRINVSGYVNDAVREWLKKHP